MFSADEYLVVKEDFTEEPETEPLRCWQWLE